MTEEKKKLETVIGTLTIWDGNDITVDGKKYPITIPVANWILDHKYQSGLSVTFEIKESVAYGVIPK